VSHPPAGAILVGKGRTAAGGKYEVLLEPPSADRKSECGASHPLSIQIVTDSGGGVSGCFSHSEETSQPRINCDEGLLTIEARTPPAVRSVRLRLSDGRQIVSPVAFLPARLGGPTGASITRSRGPQPIPVSLTELSSHGRPLRTLKMHHFTGCTKHLLKFLRDGIRPLVQARLPQGPAFVIEGEAYRFLGHIHFALKVEIVGGGGGGGGESPSGKRPGVFSGALYEGCQPHQYDILYGVLKQPATRCWPEYPARCAHCDAPRFRRTSHAGGMLVYSASSTVPSELLVRNRVGRTIITEKLGRLGAEATDTCEGESEGTDQPASETGSTPRARRGAPTLKGAATDRA
jgi:hypothetical protein